MTKFIIIYVENYTNYLGKPALSSSVHSHTADILEISNYPHIIDGVQTPNTNHPYGHDHCKFKTRTKDLVTKRPIHLKCRHAFH